MAGTWDPSVEYAQGAGGAGWRPYVKFAPNAARTLIHFALTDGHPDTVGTNSVYHMTFDGTTFRNSTGSPIGTTASLPLDPASVMTRVYDGSGASGRAWTWDVALDAAENPVITYSAYPGATNTLAPDHRLRYARWTGTAWTGGEVVAAGTAIFSGQPFYSGGIAIDPQNVNIVYTCSNRAGGNYILEKWITADNGITWAGEVLESSRSCYRPYVVRGHKNDVDLLYWTGSYTSFTVYDTEIRSRLPLRVPSAWVKIPSTAGLSTTDCYVYYGNATAPDTSSGANTWNSGFGWVNHLSGGINGGAAFSVSGIKSIKGNTGAVADGPGYRSR
jgi:hypothetical protein